MANATIQALLEALSDPVILVDARRQVVAANRRAYDVFTSLQSGKDLSMSIRHPDALAAVSRVLSGSSNDQITMTETVPVPRIFEMNVAAFPEISSSTDSPFSGAVCHLREVTAAKENERLRADFVANVSHELRSPLSALIGFIDTLKGPARGDQNATSRFLEIMEVESQRMSRLVDGLLSLSRVEAREHIPPTGVVNLEEAVHEVVSTVSSRAEEKGVSIDCSFDTDIRSINGDHDELVEVLHNLIDNALKYGRDETPVWIRVWESQRYPAFAGPAVAITVLNFGSFIAEEQIPRLTERFYRVDPGRSRTEGGTGLGLAIVKHIVNHHRGRLVISSSIEKGNDFTIFLPLINSA